MLFEKKLIPDDYRASFRDTGASELSALGIRVLLCDIDNTLAPYEEAVPSEEVVRWAEEMKNAGIRLVLISNNEEERVARFASPLGVEWISKMGKPLPKKARKLLDSVPASGQETMVLGDQLFTDVWLARNIGARVILVPPIRDRKSAFFRLKRSLEKPYMKKILKDKKAGGQR